MPRLAGGRGLLHRVCWLLVLCLAAVVATAPDRAASSPGGTTPTLRAPSVDPGAALPPAAPDTSNPAIDDLSGPPAATPFRLPRPTVRRACGTDASARSLRSHTLAIAGERGPPRLAC